MINNTEKSGLKLCNYNLNLKYRKIFNNYIINQLELKKYDRSILESELRFKKISKEKMDMYQLLSENELNFLYIRNDIYIENLNPDEINTLKKIEYGSFLSEDIMEYVEKTFSKVIIHEKEDEEIGQIKFFGPYTSKYMAPNNSIVIGIRYNDYYTNGLDDKNWSILREKQLDFLDDLKNRIINEQKNKIKNEIFIIHYNDFSFFNIENYNEGEER